MSWLQPVSRDGLQAGGYDSVETFHGETHLLADLLEQHQRRIRFLPAPGDDNGVSSLKVCAASTVPVSVTVSVPAVAKQLLRPQLLDVFGFG